MITSKPPWKYRADATDLATFSSPTDNVSLEQVPLFQPRVSCERKAAEPERVHCHLWSKQGSKNNYTV